LWEQLSVDPVEWIPEKIVDAIMIFKFRGRRAPIGDRSRFPTYERCRFESYKARGVCAYSEAISILNPVTDAIHIVQGPAKCATCATYAWNARGSFSSMAAPHGGQDNIFFYNERKLSQFIQELAANYSPRAIFIYSTCTGGTNGCDINAICKSAAKDLMIPVIPVMSGMSGISGMPITSSKAFKPSPPTTHIIPAGCTPFRAERGYEAACDALLMLIGGRSYKPQSPYSMNIMGDYNIAGDLWPIRSCFEEIGIEVVSTITGDSRVAEIQRAHCAGLNLVQCCSSMISLAKKLEEKYGTPYKRVSFLGIEETSSAIRTAAEFFENPGMVNESEKMISRETRRILQQIEHYKARVVGKRAAIYLNGASKAASLIKALRELGMEVVAVGIRDGDWVDRQRIRNLIGCDAVDVDDLDPSELKDLLVKKEVDLVIPGIKEQFAVRNLGMPFCDICHDRTYAFEGFDGMINFARDVDTAINNRTKRPPARRRDRRGRPIGTILKQGQSGTSKGCK
jgi:nitrogenase molybdenum-cofactor synthesis protein NifE